MDLKDLRFQERVPEGAELSQIPGRGLYSEEARWERLEFLRQKTGAEMASFAETPWHAESLKGHVENFLGALTIPIGVAGPLLLQTKNRKTEEIFAPIATTEGALVASITRGARAISLSGGFRAKVIQQRMTRVPMFEFADVFQATEFADWIQVVLPEIQQNIRKYSNYSELHEIKAHHVGRTTHLRFIYSTKDAAGQNMTTICTWNSCQWLIERVKKSGRFELRSFTIDGNVSADKKQALGSVTHGRGSEVIAEAVIRGSVLQEVLKVDVETLVHMTNLAKSGRLHSGVLGWNVNVSNVLAGIFAATGQDIACVSESSLAEVHVEPQIEKSGEKNLYISLQLPCLIVGTVGGGTRLPVQNEMLKMMGCQGEGKVERFSEMIAGFCLALDLSTLCAIAGGQFADAHSRLGRSSSGEWLKKGELDQRFIIGQMPDMQEASVTSVKAIEGAQFGNSLVMDMSSQVTQKLCGFFPFEIQYRSKNSLEIKIRKTLLKVKPKDEEVMVAAEMMASMCGDRLKQVFQKVRALNLFQKNHLKEIYINRLPEIQKLGISPAFHGYQIDEKRQIYLLAQQFIDDFAFEPGTEQLESWTRDRIETAIREISRVHAIFMGREQEFLSQSWIGYVPSEFCLRSLKELFLELLRFGAQEFPQWLTPDLFRHHWALCETIEQWSGQMEKRTKTLVHNDFNPRNLGFRKTDKFVAFDWELATVALPQRDSVELLSFTLAPVTSAQEILGYLDFHRKQVNVLSGKQIPSREWLEGALESIKEFITHRLALYFVAHSLRECQFLPKTYQTAMHIVQVLENELKA